MATAFGLSTFRLIVKRWLKTALAIPGFFVRSRQPYLRVLFYHRVNPYPFNDLGPVSRELTVRPDVFEAQLKRLSRLGFRSASVAEFCRMMTLKQPFDPKALLISFDDGYEDNLLWAAPLLRKYGFSALIFVVSDFLGKSTAEVWPDSDPAQYGKFLDAGQIRELKKSGIEFGSHTVSHPLLTTLPRAQQHQELETSKSKIGQLIGASVDAIAYPGGEFDLVTQECAVDAGYRLGFTTVPGVNRPGMSLTALRRTEVSASDSLLVFDAKMAGALDWLFFKENRALRQWIRRFNDLLIPLAKGRGGRDG